MNRSARRFAPCNRESGVILIQVLSVVALCSAVVVAILAVQDSALERSLRHVDGARACALALGGETSAVVALRRDAIDSPAVDHFAEAWAAVTQAPRDIEGGTFELEISDDQARFNVNNLLVDGILAEDMLRALLALSGVRNPDLASEALADQIRSRGGLREIPEMPEAGIDAAVLQRLSAYAVALSEPTLINLNTADEALIATLFGNAATARLLVARRERQGFLRPDDLASLRLLTPVRAGFQSQYFTAVSRVTQGSAACWLKSRLHRRQAAGRAETIVWRRMRIAPDRPP